MNKTDVVTLLAKVTAFDQRTVGEADVLAWHEVLADVDLDDALAAVSRHYRDSPDRIMPSHVRLHARSIRYDRMRIEQKAAPRELPSRFETDEDRDARTAAGVAKVRAVLDELAERWKVP